MNTYKVTYWTMPYSFVGGEEVIKYIRAKNRYAASAYAERKHPTWAITQVELYKTPYDEDPIQAEK